MLKDTSLIDYVIACWNVLWLPSIRECLFAFFKWHCLCTFAFLKWLPSKTVTLIFINENTMWLYVLYVDKWKHQISPWHKDKAPRPPYSISIESKTRNKKCNFSEHFDVGASYECIMSIVQTTYNSFIWILTTPYKLKTCYNSFIWVLRTPYKIETLV